MEEESININIIGSGAGFPIKLTTTSQGLVGWYPIIGDMNLIKQNLTMLFITPIGFRLREEYFGSRIWELLEEPNTLILNRLVRDFLRAAVSLWEPRIEALETTVKVDGEVLLVNSRLRLKGNSNIYDLVFNYNLTTQQINVN